MKKIIKCSNGTESLVSIESDDKMNVKLGENYKLVKFYNGKKDFKETILGKDIGVHSEGFISTTIIASFLAALAYVALLLCFRI